MSTHVNMFPPRLFVLCAFLATTAAVPDYDQPAPALQSEDMQVKFPIIGNLIAPLWKLFQIVSAPEKKEVDKEELEDTEKPYDEDEGEEITTQQAVTLVADEELESTVPSTTYVEEEDVTETDNVTDGNKVDN